MSSEGNNIYKIEIPSGAKYVVFSNNGSGKTSDLTIPGANMIYTGSWANYGEQSTTTPVIGNNCVYASGYTHAYFWSDDEVDIGGEWPGIAMTSIGNNLYGIEIPSGAKYVVFSNNGSGKTSDLTIQVNGTYSNGSWNY